MHIQIFIYLKIADKNTWKRTYKKMPILDIKRALLQQFRKN